MKTELCAATESAVRMAAQLHFDRVELCQQLEVGGITPSIGFQQFSAAWIETHVLIRPRGGDFIYSPDEKLVMLKDIESSRLAGMHGIVIGALDETGNLDIHWLQEAKVAAGTMEITCHRVFDEVKDWKASMDTLISLGFKRILTSGQAQGVSEGKETLKAMKAYAAGKIEVMAGGGVNSGNAKSVAEFVQPDALHFSGTKRQKLGGNSRYAIEALLPDLATIEEILAVIKP